MTPPQPPRPRPRLTAHPSIRQDALGRYIDDEVKAHQAATQVTRSPAPFEVIAIRRLALWSLGIYIRVRGFIVAHAAFVPAQTREYRLTCCRGCSQRKDRGDGVMFCELMLRRCKCPAWILACLWWVTRLRDTECPIGLWKEAEERQRKDAASYAAARTARRRSRRGRPKHDDDKALAHGHGCECGECRNLVHLEKKT